jgi:hypothetical protein
VGGLAEALDGVRVRATVPDGSAWGEMLGDEVRIGFAPGYYPAASEQGLQETLVALCRLLWAARVRADQAAVRAAGGEPVRRERLSRRDREYRQRFDDLVATGGSADGRVRILARGLSQWSVTADTRGLREDEFTARAAEAGAAFIRDLRERVLRLRLEIYLSAGQA